MAVIGFLGYSILVSVQAGFGMVAQDIYDTLSTYGFTVVPVFILRARLHSMGALPKGCMIRPTGSSDISPEDWPWQL
jgi:hypothetical protein